MSFLCGLPLVECVYCLACARWAWKRCLHTAGHDSENWGFATVEEFEPIPRLCRYILAVYEDDLRQPLWEPPGGYGISLDSLLLKKTYEDTYGRAPPYILYLDHEHEDIVLAIRGLNLAKESDYAQKPQRLNSKRMATQENEEDEIINPFTMLLLNDDAKPGSSTTLHQAAPNHHLLQNHSLPSIQSTITIRQLPSEGLSFQLWPAATSLVSLLDRHRADPPSSPLSATLNGRLRILELGSGTGIVGIVAAATLGGHVTLTDLPHVVPNLKFNADANAGVVGPIGGELAVAPLRWGLADDVETIGREFDLILASDVVYHDHLYEPLLETLRLLMVTKGAEREGKEKMVFVMAHMKRWKKESAFFRKAKKHFHVDVLHSDPPCDGSRVGVVVYRFVGKG